MSIVETPPEMQAPAKPSAQAFWAYWLRLGCISVGGPAAQIALMHQALVVEKRWISEARFLHALNYCMLLPGPEAQQMAVYMGWLLHGAWGGIVAGSLFVLPAFGLLVSLAWGYMQWGSQPAVAALLYGVKPLVVALVCCAAWRLAKKVLIARWLWGVFLLALVMQTVHLPFPVIILLAAVLGIAVQQYWPQWVETSVGHAAARAMQTAPSVIDDNTALAGLADLRRWTATVLICGALCGLGVAAALVLYYGPSHLVTRMAAFFSQAAFLTFGGAYAVLPYVFDASVQHYHWLTTEQMLDGLALGQSTPGPLIMVVTYIGFVAAWQAGLALPDWQAGLIGATIVTWFTFVPSFVMVFLGAPWIERTRQQWRWTAPLHAISAAVIAGMVALALTLSRHVVWPDAPDVAAASMVVLSLWLLVGKRISILWLLPACMAIGWLLKAG
jgi:chromate transporter